VKQLKKKRKREGGVGGVTGKETGLRRGGAADNRTKSESSGRPFPSDWFAREGATVSDWNL